jgi:CsoR family transcriptional regulator, copper-sensing transcriptional repressor
VTATRTKKSAGCACGVQEDKLNPAHGNGRGGRMAAASVDPAVKERNLKRLRRIEGQVRGLHAMVDDDRYCADVMTQIAAVHEALRGVGREIMRNHLRHCATNAIASGSTEAEAMYDELVDMMYRSAR